MRTEVALGLGGNLGDPVVAFATALRHLRDYPGNALLRVSSVYRTAPWGRLDQPEFCNIAALIETELEPSALLEFCAEIERDAGRQRTAERWGPRTLDIDILTYGDVEMDRPHLRLPHPRIAARAFVLVPLAEIAPDHLIGGETASKLLSSLPTDEVSLDAFATTRLQVLLDEGQSEQGL